MKLFTYGFVSGIAFQELFMGSEFMAGDITAWINA